VADIFISYSKPDRDKVVMLAAYLESEGWTVWWDTNLGAGDAYRDEIMTELAAARAVIVLWTPTSIKSDFVRAEAGRAKAEGKLIPVKASDVNYSDIPLPFGEMHTEDIGNRELIRAAVVSQLAKPALQPTALQVASKTLRYQILTWLGIVGGAITLFTHLQGGLTLSMWARWLVTNWHAWTAAFWQWCFSLINLQIPQYWTGLLSFICFGTAIVISQRIILVQARRQGSSMSMTLGTPALSLFSMRTALFGLITLALLISTEAGKALFLFPKEWLGVVLISLVVGSVLLVFLPLILLIFASSQGDLCYPVVGRRNMFRASSIARVRR
jgi:hypothetical protein